ncbi:glycoside hydrolase family protein [Microlunatus soli]|uniref:beta-fructofuranosidase n=1 Tax=Microlunatus soli TaxID=630515 RepID=A0A1H1NU52_9ACTN|nr:glycosyl hydrolase family 32 [Microlunatus soli]SDS02511.1 beta-fructofuranosidase [Microlunatus soli]
MHQLYYQHPGTWFGDCMPVYAAGAFQLFHQRDTRRPGPFGEPFGWALARTTDFVDYDDLGEVIPRGADDAQDQFIFAGSVFEAEGRFHAFYTGFNRDFAADGKPAQVLMHAVSDDLEHWTTQDGELVVPQDGYDPDDWRDPFVLRDEPNDRWVMILGARTGADKRARTGRTVWFTSTDLENWAFQGDFWAPGRYTMHEMPDLFRMGDRWYLLTTEYSDRSKTVYRSSDSLQGPWSAPVDDAFDGRAYYAARSASDGEHRYLFGWVATKEGDDDLGAWQWGGTLVVHEVYQRADRSLGVRIPETVRAAFSPATELITEPIVVSAADGRQTVELGETPAGEPFLVSMTVIPRTLRSFAIGLFGDRAGTDGYAFTVRAGERRIDFDRVPNYPWYRYDNRGTERPFTVEPGRSYRLEIVVDDSIATLYVDGVALNARAYDQPGQRLSIAVQDGELRVDAVTLATR